MKYTKEYLLSWHWSAYREPGQASVSRLELYRSEGFGMEVKILEPSQPLLAAAIILAHCNRDWTEEQTNKLWNFGEPAALFAAWAHLSKDEPDLVSFLRTAADYIECPVRQEAEKTRQQLVGMGVLPADGVQLKVKRLHPDAIMPKYQSAGAACFDLHALLDLLPQYDSVIINKSIIIRTGLAFEIPPGWVMLIFSRSGDGFKRDLRLANCVGVIDSDYRGEVQVKLTHDDTDNLRCKIRRGDRIAQAMLVQLPQVDLVEVSELSTTERGEAGFGSTGA